jgi:hypothetical protein
MTEAYCRDRVRSIHTRPRESRHRFSDLVRHARMASASYRRSAPPAVMVLVPTRTLALSNRVQFRPHWPVRAAAFSCSS